MRLINNVGKAKAERIDDIVRRVYINFEALLLYLRDHRIEQWFLDGNEIRGLYTDLDGGKVTMSFSRRDPMVMVLHVSRYQGDLFVSETILALNEGDNEVYLICNGENPPITVTGLYVALEDLEPALEAVEQQTT